MAKKPNDKRKRNRSVDASDLARVYRAGTDEQPPPQLDSAILAQARRAVSGSRAHSPFGSRWSVPLSAAAVVVLSVVLVMFMVRESPWQEQAGVQSTVADTTSGEQLYKKTPERDGERRYDPAPPSAPVPQATMPDPKDKYAEKKESQIGTFSAGVPPPAVARERANDVSAAGVTPQASPKSSGSMAQQAAVPTINLRVGDRIILTEVASAAADLERGLMHREHLASNAGMLFIFPPEWSSVCMWMKDTKIPLSAAFIDREGVVVKIADMQPLSETVHCAENKTRFVLEVNQGTFAAAKVKPGARIEGLPALPN